VAERVGRDVDAAGKKTVALHRREGAIVAAVCAARGMRFRLCQAATL